MKHCLKCETVFQSQEWQCPSCGWTPRVVEGYLAFSSQMAQAGDGFDPESFVRLAQAEQSNFWFRNRNRLIVWALQRYFPSVQSLLEIGCGTGFVLSGIRRAVPGITLAGSEIFVQGLDFARQRLPDAVLMQMDARALPFKDEFDAIGAFDVLEHIVEDEIVLGQMYKALKPGGGLLITVPQHMFLWSATDEEACHVRRYSASELKAKVERVGFEVLRQTSFVSFLLPAMLLSRRRKKTRQDAIGSCELQLPKLLNSTLDLAMRCECFFIRVGYSFPAGGSLLLLAKKPGDALQSQ